MTLDVCHRPRVQENGVPTLPYVFPPGNLETHPLQGTTLPQPATKHGSQLWEIKTIPSSEVT